MYHSDDDIGPAQNVGVEEESEDEYEEEENGEPEPRPNEPQQSLEASETSTLLNMLTVAQGGQISRLRKRRILRVGQEKLYADDGCQKTINPKNHCWQPVQPTKQFDSIHTRKLQHTWL